MTDIIITDEIRRAVFSEYGRKGGKIGGKARMAQLSPDERKALAKKASAAAVLVRQKKAEERTLLLGVPSKRTRKSAEDSKRLVRPKEAAYLLGVSVETLRGWRRQKRGVAFYRIEGSIRYRMDDLLKYIDKSRQKTSDEGLVVSPRTQNLG